MRFLNSGDKVWLRDDLEYDVKYGDTYYNKSKYKGCIVEVENVGYEDELFLAEGKYRSDNVYSYEMVDWDKTNTINECENRMSTSIFYGEKPKCPKIGDIWAYIDINDEVKYYERTKNDWRDMMSETKNIHNLSINIKTDSDFISMLFDGENGTMFKQSVGTIDIKQKLDKKGVIDELKNIIKEFE